jgi:hypothetical protein
METLCRLSYWGGLPGATYEPGGSPGYTAKGVLPKSETAGPPGLFPGRAPAVRVAAS